MNKQVRTAIPQRAAQGGFTLIELIVVIVILGILAATALPRFSNLGGDARAASLNAAAGSLRSTSAMAHGAALINNLSTAAAGNVPVEGGQINLVFGYPAADNTLALAAGVNNANDYTVTVGPGGGAGTVPAVAAGQVLIQPANGATVNCFIRYTQATSNNNVITPPVISNPVTGANC